jgi:flavin reductase (DIM6/NTAB) family NADH-FMN oxidoreductase RutF
MSKQLWRGGALLAPMPPVMVTCGSMEKPNIITIAWTGITNTIPPKTYISVRPKRHSYPLIRESGEFVINLTPRRLCETCDYCGIVTGRCVDKIGKCGFQLEESKEVSAPRLAQSPLALECRVFDIIPLGSHDMFLCDILSVAVDEDLIDEQGKLCLDRADLVAFAHGEYYGLSGVLGKFGFSVAEKKKGKGAVITDAPVREHFPKKGNEQAKLGKNMPSNTMPGKNMPDRKKSGKKDTRRKKK